MKTWQKPSNVRTKEAKRDSRIASLVLFGPPVIGFLITWWHGGFPSILLVSFLIILLCIPGEILKHICKSAPKIQPERVSPLKAVGLILAFYISIAWFSSAFLGFFQSQNIIHKILRKVEYPFSEAKHVIADSKGSIYVYSQFNKRIQKYSKEGKFQFGWFSGGWRHSGMAIGENDFIYTFAGNVRKYDCNGNIIDVFNKSNTEEIGWWRMKEDSVIWDKEASEPVHLTCFMSLKEGDLLPSMTEKVGFTSPDKTYYKLTRFWHIFPVIAVYSDSSTLECYVSPNPISLAFTFVFPGFLFYMLFLFLMWASEKPAERLKGRFLINVAVGVVCFIATAAVLIFGSKLLIAITNALPENNPLQFWLVPIVVIPYWIIIIIVAFRSWRNIQSRRHKILPVDKRNK